MTKTKTKRPRTRRSQQLGWIVSVVAAVSLAACGDGDPASVGTTSADVGNDGVVIDAHADSGVDAEGCGPAGALCKDDDPCTFDERCVAGVCGGGVDLCACHGDADCASDADNACVGTRFCDKSAAPYACAVVTGSAVVCDPSADNACAAAACDPGTGSCAVVPRNDGLACDDGSPCTDAFCAAGACVINLDKCACASDADCAKSDDADVCNGSLYCDKSGFPWVCHINPSSQVVCDTSGDSVCSKQTCTPQTGTCSAMARADLAPRPCHSAEIAAGQKACFTPLPAGTTQTEAAFFCNDGDACTAGDSCVGKVCAAGKTQLCTCASDADCGPGGPGGDDGNLCNGLHYCDLSSGACKVNPATVVVCASVNDTNCLKNACMPQFGVCQLLPSEAVAAFAVTPGAAPCSAGQPCRYEALPPGAPANEANACDDGDPCTLDEICKAGVCSAKTDTCLCSNDGDCAGQEDGDPCNGTLFCNQISKKCMLNPKSVVSCPSVDDQLCSKNLCDKKLGACAMTPVNDGLGCDADGTNCTVADSCKAGVCVKGPNICACLADSDCAALNSENPCVGKHFCDLSGAKPACAINPATVVNCPTGDDTACSKKLCDPADGVCKQTAVKESEICGDGTLCTNAKVCTAGSCVLGATIDCDDNNPCTTESCAANAGCVYKASDGSPCDDGSQCTSDDLCVKGFCTGTAADCDDDNTCTTDLCAPKVGCAHYANSKTCNDGDACTEGEACKNAVCSGKIVVCVADAIACTVEACDKNKGCESSPSDSACDDNNVCTADVCAAKSGCTYAPLAGGCDDGDPCSANDVCVAGACIAGSSEAVTTRATLAGAISALAAASDGTVWVAHGTELAVMPTGTGALTPTATEAIPGGGVGGIALANDGGVLAVRAGFLGRRDAKAQWSLRARGMDGARGVAVDGSGTAWVVGHGDAGHHVWRVGAAVIAAVANGGSAPAAVPADVVAGGASGYVDGVGWDARFNAPAGVAVGVGGELFIADSGNHRLRRASVVGASGVGPGAGEVGFLRVMTVAGSGAAKTLDGKGASAAFATPVAVATDARGRAWVVEAQGRVLRRVDRDGSVVTVAGTGNLDQQDGKGVVAAFLAPTAVLFLPKIGVWIGDGALVRQVASPLADCDDGDACTDAGCDASGKCVFAKASGLPCADDGVACTIDVCVNGSCSHVAGFAGASCAGDRCTTGAVCASGDCKGAKPAPAACVDDGNPCSQQTCLPHAGACAVTWTAADGCAATRRLFISKRHEQGDFAAKAFGDSNAVCSDAAYRAGSGGDFAVFGALPGGRPQSLGDSWAPRPIRRPDGRLIATSGIDLLDGVIATAPTLDESSKVAPATSTACNGQAMAFATAWSGISSYGSAAASTCQDWSTLGTGCTAQPGGATQCSKSDIGGIGAASLTSAPWADACAKAACTEARGVWCIETTDAWMPDACAGSFGGDGNTCGGGSGRCQGTTCVCAAGERLQGAVCVPCACSLVGGSSALGLRERARIDRTDHAKWPLSVALAKNRTLVAAGATLYEFEPTKGVWGQTSASNLTGMLPDETLLRLTIGPAGTSAAGLAQAPQTAHQEVFAPALVVAERGAKGWSTVATLFPVYAASIAMTDSVIAYGVRFGGASEGLHLVRRQGDGSWLETDHLAPLPKYINSSAGSSVDIDGDRVAVGMPGANKDNNIGNVGRVEICTVTPTSVVRVAAVEADAATLFTGQGMGKDLDLDGDRLAVTAHDQSVGFGYSVLVFDRQPSGTWQQMFKHTLALDVSQVGGSPDVALSGESLLFGATSAPSAQKDAKGVAGLGVVHVLARVSGQWKFQSALESAPIDRVRLGDRIELLGDRAAVTSLPIVDRGSVRLFDLVRHCAAAGPVCTCKAGFSGPTCE